MVTPFLPTVALPTIIARSFGMSRPVLYFFWSMLSFCLSAQSLPNIHFQEGLQHIAKQQYTEAVKSFTLYLSRDSTKAVAYYNRAIAYKNMGAREKAIADLERVLTLDPDDTLAAKHLSALLYEHAMNAWQSHDTLAALTYLNKYLKRNPKDDVAWFNAAVMLASRKQKSDALDYFSKALLLQPQPHYYLGRAIQHFEAGKYDKALPDLNRSITGTSADTLALWLRAQIHFHQKNNKAALADLKQLLTWKPGFEDARFMLNEIKIRLFLQENIYYIFILFILITITTYLIVRIWIKTS